MLFFTGGARSSDAPAWAVCHACRTYSDPRWYVADVGFERRTPTRSLGGCTVGRRASRGVDQYSHVRNVWAQQVESLKHALVRLLGELKTQGKRLAAYGASAKGSTLLNYCGIGSETLEFVADRSTVKRNKFTPGTHLPIVSPDQLLADCPDYVLLLTWNFADEILARQSAFRQLGGRAIIPIPEPTIVWGTAHAVRINTIAGRFL